MQTLTLFQLVVHDDQKGNRYHEEVEDETDLAQLPDGRSADLFDHCLVCAPTADGRGVTQDDEAAGEEDERDLSRERKISVSVITTCFLSFPRQHTSISLASLTKFLPPKK